MLESLQNILAQALYHPDTQERLAELTVTADLTPQERDLLARVQPRGLRLTHLLLMNLRFERVLRGDPSAAEWFERDAEGFVQVFGEFNRSVPPTALLSHDEAARFREFLQQRASELPRNEIRPGRERQDESEVKT